MLSYDELIVERKVESKNNEIPVLEKVRLTREAYENLKSNLDTSKTIAVDASTIKGELSLRHRQAGDSFIPLGMSGHKKIKDFFMDEKIPKEVRSSIWLVCDSEKIVWVHGMRMNERCKSTIKTKNILLISFNDIVETLELC